MSFGEKNIMWDGARIGKGTLALNQDLKLVVLWYIAGIDYQRRIQGCLFPCYSKDRTSTPHPCSQGCNATCVRFESPVCLVVACFCFCRLIWSCLFQSQTCLKLDHRKRVGHLDLKDWLWWKSEHISVVSDPSTTPCNYGYGSYAWMCWKKHEQQVSGLFFRTIILLSIKIAPQMWLRYVYHAVFIFPDIWYTSFWESIWKVVSCNRK